MSFVNNTFLGTDAGVQAGHGFGAFTFYAGTGFSAAGTFFATNNYFQDFRSVLQSNAGAAMKFTHNSVSAATCLAHDLGATCTTAASSLDSGGPSVAAGGSGNHVEDCTLRDAFNGDWHLSPGSTCAATGVADPLNPTTDLDGDARPAPSGSAIDRGADEVP